MIRVGICDDERGIRCYLGDVLEDYFMRKGLLFEVKKYATGIELLESGDQLDILFLDISMPGLDGIETGRRLREKDRELKIIYITAHEHYALEAFQVRAFQYIVKPIDQDNLYEILDRALEQINTDSSRAVLTIKYVSIFVADVTYIESGKHQIIIHTRDGEYVVNAHLKDYEVLLENLHFEKEKRGIWVSPTCEDDINL